MSDDYYEVDPRRSPSRLLRPLPTKDTAPVPNDQSYGDRNTRPAWVDAIPVPDPDPVNYGGAFDGFTVTSDADPGL
jgi:hypothetical protein